MYIKSFYIRSFTLFFGLSLLLSTSIIGQETVVSHQESQTQISQDERIPELLLLKGELSKEGELNDRYKIQLYSGSRENADRVLKRYRNKIGAHKSLITYETPNYKTWVGNYRNRLEADRALLQIKKEFPSAFIFKPKGSS